jgi:HAD superfamily hydrolase (TIGR01459 family)
MLHEAPVIPVISSLAELSRTRKAWLCDIWGVLHNGVRAFPEAVQACRAFRAQGGLVTLLSNSPRPSPGVIAQLAGLGIGSDCFDAAVTSGDVTISLLEARRGERMFHLGPERDKPIFGGRDLTFAPASEAELIVCTGLYEDEDESPEDYRALLTDFARRSVPMICGNPDRMVEKGDKLIPCAGALAEIYEELGQKVIYAGKPYRPIYDLALARIAALQGRAANLDDILAIGDGVHTDIAGASAAGIDSIFVESAIHRQSSGGLTQAALRALFRDIPRKPLAVLRHLAW